ncbi:Phosphoinositide phosphatase SAC2-like protein [Drosera capensis]
MGEQAEAAAVSAAPPYYLSKFKLYETRANFYLVGRDKSKTTWRLLKIDRSEPSELVISEDPTIYSFRECCVLLRRIHEGNRRTGGLKFVSTCYGIVGFIKFLGPYYVLLITERRKVGMICGHAIYAISKSKMIPIPHSTMRPNLDSSKNENRYKRLLRTVDITKDFFFSYAYHVMRSLQKNLSDDETDIVLYDTMFVWNAFITREVRNLLGNTMWTVALIHGFFKQVKYSKLGRTFNVTLIARRSRHYAGTRYLKRGVNKNGRAANDVETEQIVFEEAPGRKSFGISSVVQIRGSIPLFWSQETSRLNIKPDIILSNEDRNYEATLLHFQNLVARYGNPIIILNLIKKQEKKPRESILHAEFVKAVAFINRGLLKENRLKFRTLDLHKLFRLKGAKVFMLLNKVATNALDHTGFFVSQMFPREKSDGFLNLSSRSLVKKLYDTKEYHTTKPIRLQAGVLRTNCIDCLDRTNVAQYAFGLVALGHQLHALGIIGVPEVDVDDPLAYKVMSIYEAMGDTLALQYGGSAAHNKIFSERRGQWKAATQSQEFIRTLQRYLSNAYMDAMKQDAINLFLGNFQPDDGKPTLWELNSDQHYSIGSLTSLLSENNSRSILRRSLSDGDIIYESSTPMTPSDIRNEGSSDHPLPAVTEDDNKGLSESQPEISPFKREMPSSCESDISHSRYTPVMSARKLFPDIQEIQFFPGDGGFGEHDDEFDSDMLDLDDISSSGNSEEEAYDRSSLIGSPSSSSYGHGLSETSHEGRAHAGHDQVEYSDSFVRWVEHGATLIH